MAAYCGGLFFLASLTAEDIREKKLSVRKIVIFGIAALLYLLLQEGFAWQEIGRRMIPGAALLLLAIISKESIGYGDGAVVLVLGLWTGLYFTLRAVCIGILASGLFGVLCLIRKKTEPMPFLPFLLFGMEMALIKI